MQKLLICKYRSTGLFWILYGSFKNTKSNGFWFEFFGCLISDSVKKNLLVKIEPKKKYKFSKTNWACEIPNRFAFYVVSSKIGKTERSCFRFSIQGDDSDSKQFFSRLRLVDVIALKITG